MFNIFSSSKKPKDSRRPAQVKPESLAWIIPGELAVGPLPSSLERQKLLIESGVSSVLTLCNEAEGTPGQVLLDKVTNWSRIILDDSHSAREMDSRNLLRAIDQAKNYIDNSSPLYIHCVAGIERSPSVCVGYLCKYKGLQLWEALNWVKQANSKTNILDSQLRAIQTVIR